MDLCGFISNIIFKKHYFKILCLMRDLSGNQLQFLVACDRLVFDDLVTVTVLKYVDNMSMSMEECRTRHLIMSCCAF